MLSLEETRNNNNNNKETRGNVVALFACVSCESQIAIYSVKFSLLLPSFIKFIQTRHDKRTRSQKLCAIIREIADSSERAFRI